MLHGEYLEGLEGLKKETKIIILKLWGSQYIEMKRDDVKEDSNEKIVVLREQGFGDDLMFCRYLTPFKNLDMTLLACQPELIEFFNLIPELDNIKIMSQIPQQHFDKRTFLMSLPWLMSKKFPLK